jgi:hypothetical protein
VLQAREAVAVVEALAQSDQSPQQRLAAMAALD